MISRLLLLCLCQVLGEDWCWRGIRQRSGRRHRYLAAASCSQPRPNCHCRADSYSSSMNTSGPWATPAPLQRAEFSPLCLWLYCSTATLHNLEKECLHVSFCVVSLTAPQRRNSLTLPNAWLLNCNSGTRLELHLRKTTSPSFCVVGSL